MDNFKKDPVKTVEQILGVDLPDGAADSIADGVKGVLAGDKLGGVADKIKSLF